MANNDTANGRVDEGFGECRPVRFVRSEDRINALAERTLERFGVGRVLARLQRTGVEHREVWLEFTPIHGGCRVGGGKLEPPVVAGFVLVRFDHGLNHLKLHVSFWENGHVGVDSGEFDGY